MIPESRSQQARNQISGDSATFRYEGQERAGDDSLFSTRGYACVTVVETDMERRIKWCIVVA